MAVEISPETSIVLYVPSPAKNLPEPWSVGGVYCVIVDQLALEPSVLKYLPLLPD